MNSIVRRLRRARDDEQGSTLLLTIGYGALALALILVVVAATSLLIERRRLFSLADGAALAGAEAFTLEQVARSGEVASPELADAAVHGGAETWLNSAPTSLEDVALVRAAALDDVTAEVTVAAMWRPPVLTLVVPEGVRLDVTVTARAVFSG